MVLYRTHSWRGASSGSSCCSSSRARRGGGNGGSWQNERSLCLLLVALGEYGLTQIDLDGAGGRVCLIKQIGAEDVSSVCEERITIYREGEAADGEDRYVADDDGRQVHCQW